MGEIYVVIEEKREGYYDEYTHMSFDNKSDALKHAVSVANGHNGFGDDVKLHSIYAVDLLAKSVVGMRITLENGLFELKNKEDK